MNKTTKKALVISLILAFIFTSITCVSATSSTSEENKPVILFITCINGNQNSNLKDRLLSLSDEQGNTIAEWAMSEKEHMIIVPAPGTYYIGEVTAHASYTAQRKDELVISASDEPLYISYVYYSGHENPITTLNYSIHDVTRIQRVLAEYDEHLSSEQFSYLDVNGNHRIDIQDATLIQLYLAEHIDIKSLS